MLSWFSLPNLSSDQGTPLTPFPTNAKTFFIAHSSLKYSKTANPSSHIDVRRDNHALRDSSAITNNTPIKAKKRVRRTLVRAKGLEPLPEDWLLRPARLPFRHARTYKQQGSLPLFIFPSIFTRRGNRGGAQSLNPLHLLFSFGEGSLSGGRYP